MSDQPVMALSGERSSCDTVAMNSSRMRLSRSASSRALRSCARRRSVRSAARTVSFTSNMVPIQRRTPPAGAFTARASMSCQTGWSASGTCNLQRTFRGSPVAALMRHALVNCAQSSRWMTRARSATVQDPSRRSRSHGLLTYSRCPAASASQTSCGREPASTANCRSLVSAASAWRRAESVSDVIALATSRTSPTRAVEATESREWP